MTLKEKIELILAMHENGLYSEKYAIQRIREIINYKTGMEYVRSIAHNSGDIK